MRRAGGLVITLITTGYIVYSRPSETYFTLILIPLFCLSIMLIYFTAITRSGHVLFISCRVIAFRTFQQFPSRYLATKRANALLWYHDKGHSESDALHNL